MAQGQQFKVSDYYFFWNGMFSQWDSCPIVIEGVEFNCCEQWMMYAKARMFGDRETALKIMQTKYPRDQKSLGREVKKFNPVEWNAVARDIVYIGNMAKFSQNPEYYTELLHSGDKIIVEASPFDAIWGIGFAEHDALRNIDDWGTNWLGEAIMRVRKELAVKYKGEVSCLM